MKYKIAAILVLAMIGSIGIFGQENSTRKLDRQEKKDQRFIKLAEKLELAPDQKKDLFELMKDERGARRSERSARPTEDERLADINQMNQKVATILNEEQLETYLEIGAKKEATRKLRKEKKEAVKAYRVANVDPVMKGQRRKLEELLTSDEKEIIAKVRAKRGAIGTEAGVSDKRTKLSKEDKKALNEITKNHKDDIKSLMDEIADKQKAWKKDIKELNAGDEDSKRTKKKNKGKKSKKKNKDGKKGDKSKRVKGSKFLLLDPEN